MNAPQQLGHVVRFGNFELDLRSGELRKAGLKVRLQEQPFKVLAALLERPGQLVTREELRTLIWPAENFGDFDHGINLAVGKLRSALGDSAEAPRLIETIPRRGYRFLAPVETFRSQPSAASPSAGLDPAGLAPDSTPPEGDSAHPPDPRRFLKIFIPVGALIFVLLLAIGALYYFWPMRGPPSVPNARQLTKNSSENSVRSGAISPDGKYLAYSDAKGMHIELISTGETLDVPLPPSFKNAPVEWEISAGWLPDSTRFVANALKRQSHFGWDAENSIWSVSLVGTMRKVRDDALALSVSPDGAWIAFGARRSEQYFHDVWLMSPDGEQSRKLFDIGQDTSVGNLVWSPDAKRIAYVRFDKFGTALGVESRNIKGGPASEILQGKPAAPLQGILWFPDGQIGYSLTKPGRGLGECSYWKMHVDSSTGKPVERPKQITNWLEGCASSVSISRDAKHVALLEGSSRYPIYNADLALNGALASSPRRLTLTESRDIPSGWTADSKTLIFISDRNGSREIFRQAIDEETAHLIFTQPRIAGAARLSPDRSSLLYLVNNPASDKKNLMRISLTGGAPQELLSGRFVDGGARCARLPATLCVIAEAAPDRKQIVLLLLDSSNGQTKELARVDIDSTRNLNYFWDLSPDGTRIGIHNSRDPTIHIISLVGQPPLDITVNGWPGLGYMSWMPDGKAVVVGSQENRGATLLTVSLRGDVHALWKQEGAYAISGIPSPDGRHIAVWLWILNYNFWIVDNP